MKRLLFAFIIIVLPGLCQAESHKVKDNSKEITMSAVDALKITGALIDKGEIEQAESILDNLPEFESVALNIEQNFLRGRVAATNKDYEKAIKIYRKILDKYPDLARVRFELAICYMNTKQWRQADYQLRRAMAGKDLPDDIKNVMNYMRYVVRQNKNWNVYLNLGMAPDNNINTSVGGEECVDTIFGPLCRQLPEPEKAVGFNFVLGGDYEFRLSEQWRWKSDANIYANIYNKHDFDDLLLFVSSGPRYVWENGDIWFAATASRRWYGWNPYNWSAGGRLNINYDFTRKTSGQLSLLVSDNTYDDFGLILDGQTYDATSRFIHSFDSSKYVMLRLGVAREVTNDRVYSNWRTSLGIGFGIDLPAQFNVYFDVSVYLQDYDDMRWVVKDGKFEQIAESSLTQRYAVSISNSKLEVWNFVPTFTFSYMRRDSNIWQREFDKWGIEFSMTQRF